MGGIQLLDKVNGIDLYMSIPHLAGEPGLFIKDGDKYIKFTIDSAEYENFSYEYFYHTNLEPKHQEKVNNIIKVIMEEGSYEEVGSFPYFRLNNKYREKQYDLMDVEDWIRKYH